MASQKRACDDQWMMGDNERAAKALKPFLGSDVLRVFARHERLQETRKGLETYAAKHGLGDFSKKKKKKARPSSDTPVARKQALADKIPDLYTVFVDHGCVHDLVTQELKHHSYKGNTLKYYKRAKALVGKGHAMALLNNETFTVDGVTYEGYYDAIFYDLS